MVKIGQDNDVIDLTILVYTEKETELLLSIRPSSIYNENKIG